MFYLQPTFIFITCSSPWYLQHLIKTRNKQLPGLCLSLFNNREQQLTMKLGFIYFCLLISSQTRYSSVCTWLILPSLPPLQPLSQPQLWRRFTAVLPCPSTLVLGQRLHLLSYNGKLVSVYLFFKLPTKNVRDQTISSTKSCSKALALQLSHQRETRPVTEQPRHYDLEKNTITPEMPCIQFLFLPMFKNGISVFCIQRRIFRMSFYH